jgi:hypothetical protein
MVYARDRGLGSNISTCRRFKSEVIWQGFGVYGVVWGLGLGPSPILCPLYNQTNFNINFAP